MGEGATTADNYASVKLGSSWWDLQSLGGSYPYYFAGNFNSVTDGSGVTGGLPGSDGPHGDHLIGFIGNNPNTDKSLVVDLGKQIDSIGFRINAITKLSFDTTVQFFSGANGSGLSLGGPVVLHLSNGGTCTGLIPVGGGAPIPCNNAPFIAGLTTGGARSFTVSTNDNFGFYLGDLYVDSTATAPEPASFILAAGGLVLVLIAKKRRGAAE